MLINFNKKLIDLSENLKNPLYAVGGVVRNYLIDGSCGTDVDLAAAIPADEFVCCAKKVGFNIVAVYPRTSTVVIESEKERFEYTAFREEKYDVGGGHTPTDVFFTEDIEKDAKRRDFKCNAVYFDMKNDKIIDPLGGIEDIKNKRLSTVISPEKVFSHDGLRLMRLARFCGELSFGIEEETEFFAKKYADNIKDISVERVFDELKKILVCDKKYIFSDKKGHYNALKVLDKTRVLDRIIPELTLGRDMAQRSDFHDYDVLEHSLKCVLYSDESIRLAALLHDVGKPFAMQKDGKYHNHDLYGETIARDVLLRLKADKKTINEIVFLVKYHMLDMDCKMREQKVRKFLAQNYNRIDKLFLLKQADYSGCKDDTSVCPTVTKWKKELNKIKEENVPLSYKDLAITAIELKSLGFNGEEIGNVQKKLFNFAIENPHSNEKEKLVSFALKLKKKGNFR